jgi:hypothetical protein
MSTTTIVNQPKLALANSNATEPQSSQRELGLGSGQHLPKNDDARCGTQPPIARFLVFTGPCGRGAKNADLDTSSQCCLLLTSSFASRILAFTA